MHKKGDQVKVKAVTPQGPVAALKMDEDGNVSYLLRWTDASGVEQERWFAETELKAV